MESSLSKVFLIPGLALNPEIMGLLELPHFEKYYIRWIDPIGDESLASYASRIIQLYPFPSDGTFLLIGHSLGGILAQEIALSYPKARLVLISTVKDSNEIPWKIRFLRHGFAYHLASKDIILRTLSLWGWYHGYNEDMIVEALTSEVETLSNAYFIWAYKQIIHWEGHPLSNSYIHIHGDMDRTFPIQNIHNAIPVSGGDHLMIYKRASKITALIEGFIN